MKQTIYITLLCLLAWQVKAQPISLLKDIVPGTAGSVGGAQPININGTIYFTANTPLTGIELWKTTGTTASTVLVKDVYPGTGFSNPYFLGILNNKLIFLADQPTTNLKGLFVSDGTAGGTVKIGPDSFFREPPVIYNGNLYLRTYSSIYKSDGTAAGTVRAMGVNGTILSMAANSNGLFYISFNGSINEFNFFKSTGTQASVVLLKTLQGRNNAMAGNARVLTTSTSAFAIVPYLRPVNNEEFMEVLRSNGTPAGTNTIVSYSSISPVLFLSWAFTTNSSLYYWAIRPGASMLYRADDGGHYYTGGFPWEYSPNYIAEGGNSNVVYYESPDDNFVIGKEIYRTDGSSGGLLKNVNPTPGVSSYPQAMYIDNGRLFFSVSNGVSGKELWTSDGTTVGTTLLKTFGKDGIAPNNFFSANNTVYFAAGTIGTGSELWKTDGTVSGTLMVQDKNPGSASFSPTKLCARGNGLFMYGIMPPTGNEPNYLPNCVSGQTPSIVSSQPPITPVCIGSSITLSVPDNIGIGNNKNWYWYASSSCTGTPIDSGQSITVTITSLRSSYSVRGQGGCAANTNCASIGFTVLNCSQVNNISHAQTPGNQTDDFKIYPSPATQLVTIESKKSVSASIINSNGITVGQVKLQTGVNKVNVGHLPSGMYILKPANGKNLRFQIIN